MQRILTAVVILLVFCAPARAQEPLDRLKLSLGDRVDITDRSGLITTGVLTEVTGTTMRAGNRDFPIDTVLKVERPGDPVWNGFLIGAGIGVLLGPVALGECPSAACWFGPIVIWGGMGALFDFAHEGKTTIYRAAPTGGKGARITPIVAPGAGGVAIAVGF